MSGAWTTTKSAAVAVAVAVVVVLAAVGAEAVSVAQVETAGFVARARTGEEGDRMVEIRLLLAAPRLDELKEVLAKVSDPYSPSYGQYLTKEEVASYTRVEQAVIDSWQAAVTAAAPGASAVVSDYGDAVTATMTVAEAEKGGAGDGNKFGVVH